MKNIMKYKITDITMDYAGHTLHRIRALKDFGCVKAGELGGWIEKEENLSQEGLAWIFEEAKVFGKACVCGNAQVCGNAWVCGNACVCGNAQVRGSAQVCGNACVYGTSD